VPRTAAQERAVTTVDRDLCVVAGAGSGKTRVLAERFAGLVLDHGVPVDGVLALTFTDRAASEMRERAARIFSERGRPDLRRGLEGAWLSTFHGFCTRLLKENAVEAGVDPGFAVLTPTEAALRRERVREDTAERWAGERPGDLALLARLATTPDGLAEDLTALLDDARGTGRTFAELLDAEATPPAAGAAASALRAAIDALRAGIGDYSEAGRARAERVLAAAAAIPWDAADAEDPGPWEAAVAAAARAVNLQTGHPAKAALLAVREAGAAAVAVATARRAAPVARALAAFLADWDRACDREKGLDPSDPAAAARGMSLDFADLERLALRLLEEQPAACEEVRARCASRTCSWTSTRTRTRRRSGCSRSCGPRAGSSSSATRSRRSTASAARTTAASRARARRPGPTARCRCARTSAAARRCWPS
jgi:superfamily I DNA/RNA helicase